MFNTLGLNIVSEFNLENVTEYLNENDFDQTEYTSDLIPEDEAKSDIVIEKYDFQLYLYIISRINSFKKYKYSY